MTSEIFWLMKSTNIYVPVSLTGNWKIISIILDRIYIYYTLGPGNYQMFFTLSLTESMPIDRYGWGNCLYFCVIKGVDQFGKSLGFNWDLFEDGRNWRQILTSDLKDTLVVNPCIMESADSPLMAIIDPSVRRYTLGHTAQIIRSRKLCLTIIRNEWEVGMLMQHYTGPLGAL